MATIPESGALGNDPASDAEAQARADREACLATALDDAALSWSVIPIYHSLKTPIGRSWKPCQTRRDPRRNSRVVARMAKSGVAVVLGKVSGLCRIDPDCPAAEELLATLSAGDLPVTGEFTTRRGRGLLYGLPATLRGVFKTKAVPVEGGELQSQAGGSYCILSPSYHNQVQKKLPLG
jgi:hypothetical protein